MNIETAYSTEDEGFANKVHRDATDFCGEITGYFFREKVTINEAIFVPLTIFSRVIRLRDAVMILTAAGHPTEAAILLLSQFEAKLDLAQAVLDMNWATRWVEHQDTRRSVTSNITDVISVVFEREEQATEQSVFRHLSTLKHGNPVSPELGFQVRRKNRIICISTGEIEDEFSKFCRNYDE